MVKNSKAAIAKITQSPASSGTIMYVRTPSHEITKIIDKINFVPRKNQAHTNLTNVVASTIKNINMIMITPMRAIASGDTEMFTLN
jgi:hypothetical protein